MDSESFEELVQKKMAQVDGVLAMIADSGRKTLIKDALYDYCRVSVQYDEVCEQVLETGTTIINNKGNVVRNPDLMTQHQLLNEKNALLPKLLKALPDGEVKDALAAFAR